MPARMAGPAVAGTYETNKLARSSHPLALPCSTPSRHLDHITQRYALFFNTRRLHQGLGSIAEAVPMFVVNPSPTNICPGDTDHDNTLKGMDDQPAVIELTD